MSLCDWDDSPLSQEVTKRHGKYLSLGLHVGVDLSTTTGTAKALCTIEAERPRYLFCKVPILPFEASEYNSFDDEGRTWESRKHRARRIVANLGTLHNK